MAIPLRVPAALGVSLLPTDRSTASQSICPRQLQSGTFHSRLTGSGRLCLLAFLPRAAIARAMGEVVDSAAIAVGEVVDSAAQARARATVVTTPAGVTTETRQGQCTSDVVAEVAPLISGTRWLVRADFVYAAELVSFARRKMAGCQPGGATGRTLSETVTGSDRKAASFRTHSVGNVVSALALRGVGGGSSHQRVVDRVRGRSPAPRPRLRCMRRNVQTDCVWYPIVDGGVSEDPCGGRESSSIQVTGHHRPIVIPTLAILA